MKLLLDTTYVYGLAGALGDMTSAEAAVLSKGAEQLFVSAVSIWEVRLKWSALHRDGSRKGPVGPEQVLNVVSRQAVELLALNEKHAAAVLDAPLSHADPFDQLLLVQAQVEGLKLFTRDRKLKSHPCAFAV